jgi:hypothetical protein
LGYSNYGLCRLLGFALGCDRLARRKERFRPIGFLTYKLQPKAAGGRLRPGVGARSKTVKSFGRVCPNSSFKPIPLRCGKQGNESLPCLPPLRCTA